MTNKKTSYWCVVCECGQTVPLGIAVEPYEVPEVDMFKIICTHRESPRGVVEQAFGREDIQRVVWDEPLPTFRPHPQFQ